MIDYDARYREYAQLVEAELERAFVPCEQPSYEELSDAMKYSLISGGKRVRAVMLLAFYRLFDEDVERAVPLAAALEMVHAYSLIHDDLPCMDDDDERRGKPACHIAFGEATALLAGDGLLTLAFATAAGADFEPLRVVEAVRILAAAAGMHGMVGGQVMDLAGEEKQLTAEQLDAINDRKTGALFRACAEIGCVLGGGSAEHREAAREYARCIGLAFQIVDDMLDITADPKDLGKPVGSDAENEKTTYALLYGVERCREVVRRLEQAANRALSCMNADTAFLEQMAARLSARTF